MQLVAKATFARERVAQARQQVQHLTSLGLADKSAAATRTIASQEQLLKVAPCHPARPTRGSGALWLSRLAGRFEHATSNLALSLAHLQALLQARQHLSQQTPGVLHAETTQELAQVPASSGQQPVH